MDERDWSSLAASIEEKIKGLPPNFSKSMLSGSQTAIPNENYSLYASIHFHWTFSPCSRPFDGHGTTQAKLHTLHIYLRFINRRVEDVIPIARNWEKEARRRYVEPINMESDKFVEMLLLDGCFLVVFMILVSLNFDPSTWKSESVPFDDYSFYSAMKLHFYQDLIMLENQLPLFILKHLFDQLLADCKDDDSTGVRIPESMNDFKDLIQNFMRDGYIMRLLPAVPAQFVFNKNANHLVHLLSHYYKYSLIETPMDKRSENNISNEPDPEQLDFMLPPTLTELWEAGVTIKKAANDKLLMDISFKDGVLEIPHFEIDDLFETCTRNLMAFEHYQPSYSSERYVTNYVAFLDGLISTEKDVSLLVKAGILTNNIGGSNEEVSKLFNDLCKEITLPSNYYYSRTTQALRNYCELLRHRWMASFRRDYLNTPWTSISLAAAILLILLTFLQTLYSMLSYYN